MHVNVRWALVAGSLLLAPLHAGELEVGTAAVKITPPLGVPMAGYYSKRTASGVHDDLHAKTILLAIGDKRVALVALDLITTNHKLVAESRRLIEERTGIPGDCVMISATHAHTGPVLVDASERTRDLGGAVPSAIAYSRSLPEHIANSVSRASNTLRPAVLLAATGHEATLAFNRRFHMSDGTVGWNPGKLNPKILRPAGPVDPGVPFFLVRSPDGKPRAAYVNYALHLDTVGGLEISADYPFALEEVLRRVLGHDTTTMFTIGCAGDVNHIDVEWPDRQKGHAEAERIGCILAAAAIETLPRLSPVPTGKLQCHRETVELPLPEVTETDVREARETIRRRQAGERVTFLDSVRAFKVLDVEARRNKPHEVEVQVVTVGTEAAWVSLPGEIFVELGLAIKRASPFQYTAVVQLANGSIGYVPTRQAYTQGNYEVISARCAPGSGERLVEVACRLLRKAHRQATES